MEKFKHKKSLGQNFLKDENILKRIADAIVTSKEDLVIEIGPGQGALTQYLVLKDSDLVCFEIDKRVAAYLQVFENEKCHIFYEDFLNIDIQKSINNIKEYENIFFIGNIPYYITTPILEKIMHLEIKASEIVLMVQKEVAKRFTAKEGSKSYGSLTVYINYYYETEYLFEVDRKYFEPVPNVDSAVVRFKRRTIKKYNALNEEFLFKFVNDAFQFKRKNLRNNLKKYNLDIVSKILEENDYSLLNRAEQIPIKVFVQIANELSKDYYSYDKFLL